MIAPEKRKQKLTPILVLAGILLVLSVGVGYYLFTDDGPVPRGAMEVRAHEPAFNKEGELFFLDGEKGDTIHRIDIEIADDDHQRAQGLMYRSSMGDDQGMIFLFDRSEPQSFWMKNTKMSLDILFIAPDGEIVKVQPRQTPFSENQVPSERPAQFVVELIAGAAAAHGIEEGDKIVWSR